jgi:hypothetical protein
MFRQPLIAGLLAVGWLAAVGAGHSWLWLHQAIPGDSTEAPRTWPGASNVEPPRDRYALVLFVHPHCPCSRASLEELAWVLARAEKELCSSIVFVAPAEAPTGWERSALWERAVTIPGLRIITDGTGAEAKRFGVKTSGEALLYDRTGQLRFCGGITAARGHGGDNPGRRAILEILAGASLPTRHQPVFGCPLFTPPNLDERIP